MDDLVQRLSVGNHVVTVGGPQPSLSEFRKRVEDMGYVFIKFPETRGGTDLGIKVDVGATFMAPVTDVGATFTTPATGSAHVEGTVTLNYVKVRCIADIDLATLQGTGHLVVLDVGA